MKLRHADVTIVLSWRGDVLADNLPTDRHTTNDRHSPQQYILQKQAQNVDR